jgi:hypothetical protein
MAEQENSTGKGKAFDLDADPKKRSPSSNSTNNNPAFKPSPATATAKSVVLPVTSKSGTHPVVKGSTAGKPMTQGTTQPGLGPGASGAREPTPFQKAQLSSAFQGAREAQSKATLARTLGKTAAPLYGEDQDEPTAVGKAFDGEVPAAELVNRDVWKAVQAPVQSREGRRSGELYRTVIHQFAVGKNPRYENDAPDKPRGHIFVWDVSRAMNCEIPHFVGAKELSLGQTVDWLRHEGPMRGWTRASVEDAHQQAQGGMLVVVMPHDLKLKQLAIVLPDAETTPDGKPFVAAAGKQRGNRLKLSEALGVFAVDCFVHV